MYPSTWRTTLAVCLPSFLPSCPNQLTPTINNAVVIITLSASARPSLRACSPSRAPARPSSSVELSRPLKLSRLVTICLTRRDRGSETERERERGSEGGRDVRTTNAALPLLHSPHSRAHQQWNAQMGREREDVKCECVRCLSLSISSSSRQPNEHRAVQCSVRRKKERKKESVTVENAVKTFFAATDPLLGRRIVSN